MKTRWAPWLGLAGLLCASPLEAGSSTLVINELRTRGPGGVSDEFIELYNVSQKSLDLQGYKIRVSTSAGVTSELAAVAGPTWVHPGNHFLIVGPGYSGPSPVDLSYAGSIDDDGGIALVDPIGNLVDQVGMSMTSAYLEGSPLTPLAGGTDQSYERSDPYRDVDDNGNDFQGYLGPKSPSTPETASCASGPCLTIDDVTVIEGNFGSTTLSIAIRLQGHTVTDPPVTVRYETPFTSPPGCIFSAGLDVDFRGTSAPAPLEFTADGVQQATFRVLTDTQNEPDECFEMRLIEATNATVGDGSGLVRILDDDFGGTWAPTSRMAEPRRLHTATLLMDGRVLVVGGSNAFSRLASVEIYDPLLGTWALSAPLPAPRDSHSATLLESGKVLIAGGRNATGPTTSALLFDPETGTWSTTASSTTVPTLALRLLDGRVLAVGASAAEAYDPGSEAWAPTGPLASGDPVTATLLPDGRVLALGDGSAQIFDPGDDSWTAAAAPTPRTAFTATLLGTGRVLVVGGTDPDGARSRLVESFDPVTGLWAVEPALPVGVTGHQAALASDGTVVVSGGEGSLGYGALAFLTYYSDFCTCEFSTWDVSGSMPRLHWQHTLTPLPDGRVLVAGDHNGSAGTAAAEIYRSQALSGAPFDTVRAFPVAPRVVPKTSLLPTGELLMAGGLDSAGALVALSELYDAATGTVSPTGSLLEARTSHQVSLLPSGKVLATGGRVGPMGVTPPAASAELYDPGTGAWSPATAMTTGRMDHTAVLLASGRVLVAGGASAGFTETASAEIYDPDSDSWAPTGSMVVARSRHAAVLLRDGDVLVAGGVANGLGSPIADTEIWDSESGTWAKIGSLAAPRESPLLVSLLDGRVVAMGGLGAGATVEIFDPVTRTWSDAGSLDQPPIAAILLPSGDVLSAPATGLREIYDPVARSAFSPSNGRTPGTASLTLMGDGRIAAAGWRSTTAGGMDLGYLPVDLGQGSQPRTRSTITSVTTLPEPMGEPSGIRYGGSLSVTGLGFRGDSEASSGTNGGSRANSPTLELRSIEGGRVARLVSDVPVDLGADPMTIATTRLPTNLHPGWHLLSVITAGVRSIAAPVRLVCSISVTDPLDQIGVVAGTPASFGVTAEGAASFQWQRLLAGAWQDIPGATGATYTTPPVAGADSGAQFRVIASNGCTSETTAAATLTIADAIAPSASVISPSGGEYWLLSDPDSPANTQVISWAMSDNVRICQVDVELRYSDDGGASYASATSDVLPATFPGGGATLPCPFPGEGTTSLTYTVPTAPPSGTSGSLYKVRVTVTDHVNRKTVVESPNPFFIVKPNPDSVKTLILSNTPRMQQVQGISGAQKSALESKLQELARHPRVLGFVVKLEGVSDVLDLYSAWDGDTADPNLANNLLFGCHDPLPAGCTQEKNGIHDTLRTLLSVFTGVEYVVLVGDDRIIPFARITDRTTLLPEQSYPSVGPGQDLTPTGTTVGQALAANQYLSDDPLAVLDAVRPDELNGFLYIPDLSFGRLVETPEEITAVIATYISQDGILDLSTLDPASGHKVLVTGYDFLLDVGKRARSRWKTALGVATPDGSFAPVAGSLISTDWGETTVSDRQSALRTLLAGDAEGSDGDRYGIASLNGHASHFGEGVPGTDPFDIQGLDARDIYGDDSCSSPGLGPLSLAGGVVYGLGCHGGLPVPGSCATDAEHSLDLPQAFLSRGILSYVANTGYGWGLKNGIGYGERLTEILTEEMTRGGTLETGAAVKRTKERYFLEAPRFDPYDEKSLMQWTLFGLPMYAVKTGIDQGAAAAAAAPEPFAGPPLASAELGSSERYGDVVVERRALTGSASGLASRAAPLPAYLTQLDLHFDFSAPGVYTKYDAGGDVVGSTPGCPAPAPGEPSGCYYTLNGLVERATGAGDLPIQPYFIFDSRLSGTSQHGVLWRGGEYDEESGWLPVIGELISNDAGGVGTDPGSAPRTTMVRAFAPRFVKGFDPDQCRASDREVNSLLVPAGEALKPEESDPAYTIERRYRSVDLEVFYYNNTGSGSGNCDRQGPELGSGPFSGAYHQVVNSTISWVVPASDSNTGGSGVWRVLVVYNDGKVDAQGRGMWTPLDLEPVGGGAWSGEASFAGTSRVTYVIQAVDNVGNVTWLYYVPAQLPNSGVDPGLPDAVDVPITTSSGVSDLRLFLVDSPDPVSRSTAYQYSLYPSNLGPDAATGVEVTLELPSGVSVSTASGVGWACSPAGTTVTCARATLAVGTGPLISVVATAPSVSGTLSAAATLLALESDPNGTNNTVSETTTVDATPVSDLSVTLDDEGRAVYPGDPLRYTLTVANAGPDAVTGATVSDTFPAELLGVSWTCTATAGSSCPSSGTGNIAALVDLEVNGSATWSIAATVDPETLGAVTNTATASLPSGVVDPVLADNTATVTTETINLRVFRARQATPRPGPTPAGLRGLDPVVLWTRPE